MTTENSVETKVTYSISVSVPKGTQEEWDLFLASKKVAESLSVAFDKFLAAEITKAAEAAKAAKVLADKVTAIRAACDKEIEGLTLELTKLAKSQKPDYLKIAELGQKIGEVKSKTEAEIVALQTPKKTHRTSEASGDLTVSALTIAELKSQAYGYTTNQQSFVFAHSSIVSDKLTDKLGCKGDNGKIVVFVAPQIDFERKEGRRAWATKPIPVSEESAFVITVGETNTHSGIENAIYSSLLAMGKIKGSSNTSKQPFMSTRMLVSQDYSWLKK